ncbi:MAG TPA: flagellar type III secretion system protein FliR, partial [Alphaproteobacteria bacterium]|nr:flagellar type III secretion system protein FliR [Alphaproteobacteria bacterium]
LVGAMHDSYQLFHPGSLPAPASFAELATQTVGQAFAMGIQLAAPFIVFGIIFNTGIGLLARLMPQVQIFFIAVPGQILLGFMIMGMIFSSMMLWYLDYFEAGVTNLLIAR